MTPTMWRYLNQTAAFLAPASVVSAENALFKLAGFLTEHTEIWGLDALGGPVTDPAWRAKPSWYLVTTEDRMIPPAAQRTMSQRAGATVVEVAASHSVYVSQPAPVADLIKQPA